MQNLKDNFLGRFCNRILIHSSRVPSCLIAGSRDIKWSKGPNKIPLVVNSPPTGPSWKKPMHIDRRLDHLFFLSAIRSEEQSWRNQEKRNCNTVFGLTDLIEIEHPFPLEPVQPELKNIIWTKNFLDLGVVTLAASLPLCLRTKKKRQKRRDKKPLDFYFYQTRSVCITFKIPRYRLRNQLHVQIL